MSVWKQLRDSTLSIDQVRAVDRLAIEEYGMHSLVLMENAALGCVHWLREKFADPQRCVVLAGPGNNGGDGYAIARHLRYWGWQCSVLAVGPATRLSADALENYRILTKGDASHARLLDAQEDPRSAEIRRLIDSADIILDSMLGTGATGDPRPPMDAWIEFANTTSAFRVAIDIPTGVDGRSGARGQPCFDADATLTFVAKKPAMSRDDTNDLFGEITVLPIGIPEALMRQVLEWIE